MTDKVTKCAPALANGAEGKVSTNCRKSLDDQRAAARKAAPKAEPEVTTAKAAKAIKRATPKAKAAKAPKGARLSLKQNREVRGLLTTAAQAAGGTRLTPIGFESYTAFLAGIPLDADGNATVSFVPVKGNEPVKGKNVKLTVRAGKVVSVK